MSLWLPPQILGYADYVFTSMFTFEILIKVNDALPPQQPTTSKLAAHVLLPLIFCLYSSCSKWPPACPVVTAPNPSTWRSCVYVRYIYIYIFLCVSHFSITAHPPFSSSTCLWTSGSPEYNYLISNITFFFFFFADLTLWLWWHLKTFHQQSSFSKHFFFVILIRRIIVSKNLKCSWLWRDELEHQALHPTAWLRTVHTDVPLFLVCFG